MLIWFPPPNKIRSGRCSIAGNLINRKERPVTQAIQQLVSISLCFRYICFDFQEFSCRDL